MKRKLISLLLLTITFTSLNIFTQVQQFTYDAANGNNANSYFLPDNAFKNFGKTSDVVGQNNIPEINILAEKQIYYPYYENDLLTIPVISVF